MFNNKTILITGGTGSFGNSFVKHALCKYKSSKIIIYSRDEMKQWDMANKLNNSRTQFIIGDVRDKDRLNFAMRGVDFVVHAAATKIVPTAEYNPFECIKTNINGAMNVIEAAYLNKIKKVVALSTDKASNPINLYGATKLASDKLFIASNNFTNHNDTKFSVVRYGNVMGSRGSVIPYFIKQSHENGFITITDKSMTRFMINLDEAVGLVFNAFQDMLGGEIYVKKIPSMNIMDIAKAVSLKAKIKFIGIRPGEKLHEQMIGSEDAAYTYEYKEYYKILPMIYDSANDKKRIKNGKKVQANFTYSSDKNTENMSIDFLKNWILQHKSSFINI